MFSLKMFSSKIATVSTITNSTGGVIGLSIQYGNQLKRGLFQQENMDFRLTASGTFIDIGSTP
jgi:hypothetical protein